MSLRDRFDEARASYFASRQRQLRQRGLWTDALDTLVDEADWLSRRAPGSSRWPDLLMEATEVAANLDDLTEYRAFLRHFADHVLPEGPGTDTRLWDALKPLEDLKHAAALEVLGSWLTLARPESATGPYLEGHAIEGRHATPDDRRRADQAFALAAHRAELATTQDPAEYGRLQRHCELRRGALSLNTGLDRRATQTPLGHLNWSMFSRAEQLWMAHALTHSERWIDRVRVIDLLLDALRETPDRTASAQDPDELRTIARELLSNAPLQLHPAELERLPELIATLFDETECAHWQRHLQARERLQHLVSSPLQKTDAAAEVKATLERLALDAPSRWQPVAQHAAMLLTRTEHHPDSPVPINRDPLAEYYATLSETLASLDREHPPAGLLGRLNAAARALEDDTGALRALALIWPELLEQTSADSRARLLPELLDLASLHARGPSPSYGWWALAAHLYRAGLPGCALPFAERARQEGSRSAKEDIIFYVKSKTLKEAASRRDAALARSWLTLSP
ncbi:hypothetical protein EA187_11525 [Lujinxingia sediminis]|uniref:DUF4034 domain-containing protein n=1 Tax=Lujinxingia sediminis TaxID=2480984 RepID=A0ABY0CSU7_9DELT|nr:hypothetical protein [Lujinxingia sediminis]RVU44169.1 hypothetical protein EA187_11525 [Lujinxingia sediminis]